MAEGEWQNDLFLAISSFERMKPLSGAAKRIYDLTTPRFKGSVSDMFRSRVLAFLYLLGIVLSSALLVVGYVLNIWHGARARHITGIPVGTRGWDFVVFRNC